MKIVFLFLTSIYSLFAVTINESLLQVHSVLVPKLTLMDYQFNEKIKNDSIEVVIVYQNSEYKSAKLLQNQIDEKYSQGIQSYSVETTLVDYKELQHTAANIYYLFPSTKENIKLAIEHAKEDNALTFAYNNSDLHHGVMISVNIENKIKPILNLSAIKKNQINLRPVLLNISLIYRKRTSSIIKKINKRLNTTSFYSDFIEVV